MIECWFLVPSPFLSPRRQRLEALLVDLGGGFQGPEVVHGNYKGTAEVSLRYSVALGPEGRIALRRALAVLARELGEECLYFVVGAEVEFIPGVERGSA